MLPLSHLLYGGRVIVYALLAATDMVKLCLLYLVEHLANGPPLHRDWSVPSVLSLHIT